MKTNNTFNKTFWISIGIFTFVVALICFFPFWFTSNSKIFDFSKTGQIGDTIGGIMGPFIAIAASALTFLAFWVQFKANQEQRLQFQIQNQDQLFFRLMDSQESKIINSTFKDGRREFAGFQILEHIVSDFNSNISIGTRLLARNYIIKNFDTLDDITYNDILAAKNTNIQLYSSEKQRFVDNMSNSSDKLESIKEYFGTVGSEDNEQAKYLVRIGMRIFYSVDFTERKFIYLQAFENIIKKYGSFLDSYLRGCEFIFEHIKSSKNEEIYNLFYLSQLSKFEKILIYYHLASGKISESYKNNVKELNLLKDIQDFSELLFDMPPKEILEKELKFILN